MSLQYVCVVSLTWVSIWSRTHALATLATVVPEGPPPGASRASPGGGERDHASPMRRSSRRSSCESGRDETRVTKRADQEEEEEVEEANIQRKLVAPLVFVAVGENTISSNSNPAPETAPSFRASSGRARRGTCAWTPWRQARLHQGRAG